MSGITIMSKQPPGGRCSLYMRYAETLKQSWVSSWRSVSATMARRSHRPRC